MWGVRTSASLQGPQTPWSSADQVTPWPAELQPGLNWARTPWGLRAATQPSWARPPTSLQAPGPLVTGTRHLCGPPWGPLGLQAQSPTLGRPRPVP